MNPGFWHNRKVLVTGHTGFKGSWLVFWLSQLGAEIIGVSLPALKVKPSLYFEAKISKLVSNEYFVDIRNSFGTGYHKENTYFYETKFNPLWRYDCTRYIKAFRYPMLFRDLVAHFLYRFKLKIKLYRT